MNEPYELYLGCLSTNNAQAECKVSVAGDLMQVRGHPMMHFAPQQAASLRDWISAYLEKQQEAGASADMSYIADAKKRALAIAEDMDRLKAMLARL